MVILINLLSYLNQNLSSNTYTMLGKYNENQYEFLVAYHINSNHVIPYIDDATE